MIQLFSAPRLHDTGKLYLKFTIAGLFSGVAIDATMSGG